MYKILFDIIFVSSVLYASILTLLISFLRRFYYNHPNTFKIFLILLFFGVCLVSIRYPIALYEYVPYSYIINDLLIAYGIFVGIKICILLPWYFVSLHRQNKLDCEQLQYIDDYKSTLAKNLHIKRSVSLQVTTTVNSPFTWGWIKPIIAFPKAAVNKLTSIQIQSLLLHELIHIKKKDYLTGICLYVIQSIFFFNPFIRWWIKEIQFLQEVVCDKNVVKYYSIKEYIEALLFFTKYKSSFSFLKISAKYDLYNRIALMLGEHHLKSNLQVRYSSLVCVFLLFISQHYTLNFNHRENAMVVAHQEIAFVPEKRIHTTTKKYKLSSKSIAPTKMSIPSFDSNSFMRAVALSTPQFVKPESNPIRIEDIDLTSKKQQNVYSIHNKTFIIPDDMNRDSLIVSMVSKATFIIMNEKNENSKIDKWFAEFASKQEIKDIQENRSSQESIDILKHLINTMYDHLYSHIEYIDWRLANMELDNEVADIILKQQDYQ